MARTGQGGVSPAVWLLIHDIWTNFVLGLMTRDGSGQTRLGGEVIARPGGDADGYVMPTEWFRRFMLDRLNGRATYRNYVLSPVRRKVGDLPDADEAEYYLANLARPLAVNSNCADGLTSLHHLLLDLISYGAADPRWRRARLVRTTATAAAIPAAVAGMRGIRHLARLYEAEKSRGFRKGSASRKWIAERGIIHLCLDEQIRICVPEELTLPDVLDCLCDGLSPELGREYLHGRALIHEEGLRLFCQPKNTLSLEKYKAKASEALAKDDTAPRGWRIYNHFRNVILALNRFYGMAIRADLPSSVMFRLDDPHGVVRFTREDAECLQRLGDLAKAQARADGMSVTDWPHLEQAWSQISAGQGFSRKYAAMTFETFRLFTLEGRGMVGQDVADALSVGDGVTDLTGLAVIRADLDRRREMFQITRAELLLGHWQIAHFADAPDQWEQDAELMRGLRRLLSEDFPYCLVNDETVRLDVFRHFYRRVIADAAGDEGLAVHLTCSEQRGEDVFFLEFVSKRRKTADDPLTLPEQYLPKLREDTLLRNILRSDKPYAAIDEDVRFLVFIYFFGRELLSRRHGNALPPRR